MFGAAGNDGSGVLAPLTRRLEAEQERWFFWLPVFIGCGIALYFALPCEPSVLTALVPLVAVIAWRGAGGVRAMLATLLIAALLAATLGFALAKLRVEWVRAPVLAKQMNAVEVRGYVELIESRPARGQRLTLRVTSIGDLPGRRGPCACASRPTERCPG